ncbi:chemotaxis protein CheX [Alicyclobacillus dauci]|uniref:Chemotaxis protein CheX n=1 Tax=Alicyclobacillus dauci TaxID=1475485 RepID=A0ABY6Z363_9BACL|nr:chemotaxis protein CheX [Alicyclobacillus dauci]WAH36410.1 chemotaxis protein CheX [Alicyclobacillus dauci]
METATLVTEILNGTLSALSTVVPFPIEHGNAERLPNAFRQPEMGVLIGVTGDYHTRLVIDAKKEIFMALGASMYGMTVEGELLDSLIGEVGNMVGGNMCTNVSMNGIHLDITPPTVLIGDTKLTGFTYALSVPVIISSIGALRVSLLITE